MARRKSKSSTGKRPVDRAMLRTLGQQLRRLRLERKMSQEVLAERSGLNYKHIGQIELGNIEPGADVLVCLARGLTVPVGELFETITPTGLPSTIPTADLDGVSAALATLTEAVERLRIRPASLPPRAPRTPASLPPRAPRRSAR